MSMRSGLAAITALLSVGLLVAHLVLAADPAQDQAIADEGRPAKLLPGTKCVITAELDCEIHEVDAEAIFVTVTALREAERGVPIHGKSLGGNRLFRNVGVGRSETKVILSIPRERIKAIVRVGDGTRAEQ